jgi:teichuronic acid biosynthesis glycosyltransferase TuaH
MRFGGTSPFVTHLVPFSLLPASLRWTRRHLDAVLSRLGIDTADYLMVDQPSLEARSERFGKTVYRPTDVYGNRRLQQRERALSKYVDAIVATSQTVLDTVPTRPDIPSLVLPNGVEFKRFGVDLRLQARSREAVYVGSLDQRFDWEAVEYLASAFPDVKISLYGPIPPAIGGRRRLPDNVRLMGQLNYDLLPSVLRAARVGLLPMAIQSQDQNTNAANVGRSPMKLFEYLAAELYVVAQATPTIQRTPLPGVALYSDRDEMVQMFRRALASSDSGSNREGSLAAEGEDWSNKVNTLVGFLDAI